MFKKKVKKLALGGDSYLEKEPHVLKDLEIQPESLSDECERQASLIGRYASLASDVRCRLRQLKLRQEYYEAEQYLAVRQRLETDGRHRVTERAIYHEIVKLPKYQLLRDHILEKEKRLGLLEAVCEGLRHKKSMLEQLAMDRRSELYGDVSISRLEDRVRAKMQEIKANRRNK